LPFLPLLPKQILLTNLLTDIPEMTIATDSVDRELIEQPKRWDIAFIRKFMLTFGFVSSLFDYLTFRALLVVLHASQDQFRTGWFVESVISASAIVLVIRTRRTFFTSRPGQSRPGHPCCRSNDPAAPLSADRRTTRIEPDAAVLSPAFGDDPDRLYSDR